MANISELVAHTERREPGWIAALSESRGFVAQALGSAHHVQAAETDAELERKIAEAYDRGREEGTAEAAALYRQELEAREKLKLALARLNDAAQAALRQQLAETVAQLCEKVIEPHLVSREAIAQRCTALAEQIGEAPDRCTLHIHPDDAALLDNAASAAWTIRHDANLPRGALRLEGREGMVRDGPDEWRRAIREALAP